MTNYQCWSIGVCSHSVFWAQNGRGFCVNYGSLGAVTRCRNLHSAESSTGREDEILPGLTHVQWPLIGGAGLEIRSVSIPVVVRARIGCRFFPRISVVKKKRPIASQCCGIFCGSSAKSANTDKFPFPMPCRSRVTLLLSAPILWSLSQKTDGGVSGRFGR